MNIYFLINLKSGSNKGPKLIEKIASFISSSKNDSVQYEAIDFENLEAQLTEAKKSDTIVICGGDGTVSSLLIKLIDHPRVGILPLGTANDFSRELNLDHAFSVDSPKDFIEFFSSSSTKNVTLGFIEYGQDYRESTHFLNYVSFGFDAKVVSDFSRLRKTKFFKACKSVWANRFFYVVLSLLNVRFSLKKSLVELGDSNCPITIKKSKSIIVANISSMLGVGRSNLTSSPFDRTFEVLVTKNPFDYILMIFKMVFPRLGPLLIGSAEKIILSDIPPSCPVQIDGEARPDISGSKIRVSSRSAVSVIVP